MDEFSVLHCGTLDKNRMASTVLHAVVALKQSDPNMPIRLTFVGSDPSGQLREPQWRKLKGVIEEIPPMPYDWILERMQSASVLLLIDAPMKSPIWLAGKFAEYAAVSRPILALTSPGSPARELLERWGGGECCDPTDRQGVAEALGRMYVAWKRGSFNGGIDGHKLRAAIGPAAVTDAYRRVIESFRL